MSVKTVWSAASGQTACSNRTGDLVWLADLDAAPGTTPAAPSPHQLLDSALGSCTALTLQLYAKRKGYDLRGVAVEISHESQAGTYQIRRSIQLQGELDAAQRADLLRVAEKCPVHKTLSGSIAIATELR